MNKISKKIVALVTMAAFVLTLVPAAAFAAADASVQTSAFNIVDENGDVLTETAVTVGSSVIGQFVLKTSGNVTATENDLATQVWATENGQVTDALKVEPVESTTSVSDNTDANTATGGKVYSVTGVANGETVAVSFERAGTYVVYAGTKAPTSGDGSGATLFAKSTACTITVTDKETKVTGIAVSNATGNYLGLKTDLNAENTYGVAFGENAVFNGIEYGTVTATLTGEYTEGGAANDFTGKVLSFENDYASMGLTVVDATTGDEISEVTVKTGNTVDFGIKAAAGTPDGIYLIKLSADGVSSFLKVQIGTDAVADTTPTTIEAVDGLTNFIDVTEANSKSNVNNALAQIAQFAITDADGNAVTASIANQYASYSMKDDANHAKYVKVTTQPKGSKLTGSNFYITNNVKVDGKYYTLQTNDLTSLTEGEYTVVVYLNNGNSAEVNFTVSEFGKMTELKINLGDSKLVAKEDGSLTPVVVAVDDKGMEKDVTASCQIGFGPNTTAPVKMDGNQLVFDTTKIGEGKTFESYADVVGTKVELIAVGSGDYAGVATADVTVAEDTPEAIASELTFDSNNGVLYKNNPVTVTLVDENGDAVTTQAGQVVGCYTVSSTDDAKVIATVTGNKQLNADGKVNMTIYSDKETTANIMVYVKLQSGAIVANTLTYTIGEDKTPEIPVNTTIAMTIGSNDFVVNNSIVNVPDAAPYIANDRTYVPFRALGEALGAEVVWDNDARTVTYTLGDTEIVMTIGEKTYTVNGEEKTMDVAPEITNDRTYVPVRFVGEAFGFTVTALSADNGTTAAVVFQK